MDCNLESGFMLFKLPQHLPQRKDWTHKAITYTVTTTAATGIHIVCGI